MRVLLFTCIFLWLLAVPLCSEIQDIPPPNEKLGLALSGGGARGFAHIGILKVLEENGIYPDYISGTSVGAIVGALYAMGYNASEIEEIALSINWSEVFEDNYERSELYIGQKRWAPYGNAVFDLDDRWSPKLPQGVYKGNQINYELFRFFASTYKIREFKDLPIPFSCVATDLITGEEKVFDRGSLMHAVRASVSIPSIVEPHFFNGNYYIDGGIVQNFPVEQVIAMGANKVIGLRVNSSLYKTENLSSIVRILEQTINIGMTRNVNESNLLCDLLIDPSLEEFSATDFRKIKQIIDAGEFYAREQMPNILTFRDSLCQSQQNKISHKLHKIDPLWTVEIDRIRVNGNKFVSSLKVKEYTRLESKRKYSITNIIEGCRAAWNSQAFDLLYPSMEYEDGQSILVLNVRERERKHLAMNFSYDSSDALVAGVVLSLQNYLMKNSIALAEVKVGGRNELNLDLVKNFGELWGVYYRLFPFINERMLYSYVNHYKTNSTRSLEYGINTGIGLFANKIAVAEVFVHSSQTRLYRGISESEPTNREFVLSGFGIKGYHESVDDYAYPMYGMRMLGKFNFSRSKTVSDFLFTRLQLKSELYYPLVKGLSIKACMDWGTFFDRKEEKTFDPFEFGIGGIGSYLALSPNEISAADYKIYEAGLISEPFKKIYLMAGIQGLNYTNSQTWSLGRNSDYCAYAGLGYKSVAGPMNYHFAIDKKGLVKHYLNLGWTSDVFKFSRY